MFVLQGTLPRAAKRAKANSSRKFLLVQEDGQVVTSRSEENLVFRTMFSQQVGGEHNTFQDVIERQFDFDSDFVPPNFVDAYDLALILPTVSEVASRFAKAKVNQTGENTYNGAIFKMFPKLLSQLFYPLYLKSLVFLSPPIQWKGGMLCQLF